MFKPKTPTKRVLAGLVLATALASGAVAATAVTTHVRATAGPCTSWRAHTPNLVLNLSNGQTATFELNSDGSNFSDRDVVGHLAVPNQDGYDGAAAGLVAGGNGHIDFTVIWTPRSGHFGDNIQNHKITSRFTGDIAADGTARGNAIDNKNYQVNWTAPAAFSCVQTAPNPDNPPASDPKPQNVNCDDPAQAEANGLICKTAPYVLFGPKDVVTMSIDVSFGTATVDIVNTNADISGTCTYDATNTANPKVFPVNKTFDLAKSGSTSFSLPAPPFGSTYHVVLSCKGPWNKKTVEFGHVEKDVTAAG